MRRIALVTVSAAALGCLVTYALLGFYSRWIADDFCTAAAMKAEGFWASQATMYRTWSGRYLFTFVINVVESAGPVAAHIVPIATIIAWIAAAAFAARRLFAITWPIASAAAMTFVFAAIDGAPDAFQSLLWQTGALTYIAPLVLLTLWTASLAKDRITIAGTVLPFVAGAFSETAVVCEVAGLTVALLLAPKEKRKIVGAALVSSLLALAIVAAAPGNAIRRARFPPSRDLSLTLANTLVSTINFLSQTTILNIASLALVAMIFALCGDGRPRPSPRVVAGTVLAAIAATAAAFFASIHVMTLTTPARALVIPETMLVIAFATLGLYVPARLRTATAVLAIALTIAPVMSAIRNANLLPAARQFAQTWDRMNLDLRMGRGDLTVAAPETVGSLNFVAHDPAHWANQCVARYYGVTSVRSGP